MKKPFDAAEIQQIAYSLTEKWSYEKRVRLRIAETTRRCDSAERSRARLQATIGAGTQDLLDSLVELCDRLLQSELNGEQRKTARAIKSNLSSLDLLINHSLDSD